MRIWTCPDDLRQSPNFHQPHDLSLVRLAIMNARAREGLRDKVRYFLGYLFSPSPEDWSWVRMPAKGNAFYIFLRPLRLFFEYGLKPMMKKNNAEAVALPLDDSEYVRTI
jgi:hypothetical protein